LASIFAALKLKNAMNIPKPLCIQINEPLFSEKGLELFLWILGEDIQGVGGNKTYKLKYNIEAFLQSGKKDLLTFGGAYSNHLAATAAAASACGFSSIGVVRGEMEEPLNPTLSLATQRGMKLAYIGRSQYRDKESLPLWVQREFGEDVFVIPEGGSNADGMKGCRHILDELELQPDLICVACGTGTTLAGMAGSAKGRGRMMGFPALRSETFMSDLIAEQSGEELAAEISLIHNYHFGGYARHTPALLGFLKAFRKQHNIELDFVYTAKMMFGIYDLARRDYFKPGQQILAVHTGGIQGNAGLGKELLY
jgi:1-aminocyclopropane-1-carboxylate deaminase